jgi:hypothetical protein
MQTIKQIVKNIGVGLFLIPVMSGLVALASTPAQAAELQCSILPSNICNSAKNEATGGKVQGTGVYELLKFVLQILTAGIGIVAVGSIVYAGILYASAGDNQQQVQNAKNNIKNVAIGIVAFGLMFIALNWLIPGGVFG